MKYTIKQFEQKFPNDHDCLQYMFAQRFGNMPACPTCGVSVPRYYRVRSKKVYECKDCGNQIRLIRTCCAVVATPYRKNDGEEVSSQESISEVMLLADAFVSPGWF